jgi:hypothetical protein
VRPRGAIRRWPELPPSGLYCKVQLVHSWQHALD